ncbi:MAG: hypothetical protein HW380_2964 [Magnetococcales bacterium]|nr:hypothetical protein [Magnetococcales bacterium]
MVIQPIKMGWHSAPIALDCPFYGKWVGLGVSMLIKIKHPPQRDVRFVCGLAYGFRISSPWPESDCHNFDGRVAE